VRGRPTLLDCLDGREKAATCPRRARPWIAGRIDSKIRS
jgi:hypothetical protein